MHFILLSSCYVLLSMCQAIHTNWIALKPSSQKWPRCNAVKPMIRSHQPVLNLTFRLLFLLISFPKIQRESLDPLTCRWSWTWIPWNSCLELSLNTLMLPTHPRLLLRLLAVFCAWHGRCRRRVRITLRIWSSVNMSVWRWSRIVIIVALRQRGGAREVIRLWRRLTKSHARVTILRRRSSSPDVFRIIIPVCARNSMLVRLLPLNSLSPFLPSPFL